MSVFQARVTGQLFGENVMNVLHFQKPEASEQDKALLAQKLRDNFYGQISLLCSNQMQFREIMVFDPTKDDDLPVIMPIVVNGFHNNQDRVINHVCAVFKLHTAHGGRTGRGRFFVSGIDLAGTALGRWNNQQMIQLESVATSLEDWFTGDAPQSTFNLCVARRGAQEPDFKRVTLIVPREYPGTQVRRNFFRGQ